MFFSTMLGTIILSMYCTYSLIISFTLALKLFYQRKAPKKLKVFFDNFVKILFKDRNLTEKTI